MKKKKQFLERQVMVEGLMTFGKLETGLRTLDFQCCEEIMAEPFKGNFHVPGMRDGNVYMQQNPKRVRSNSLLIRKAKHGRLSGTRDKAWQLTLKVFASEGIDWQKAFVEEPIELMADLIGPERMRKILSEASSEWRRRTLKRRTGNHSE